MFYALGLTLVQALDAGLARLLLHLAFQSGVEMILDVIVRAAIQVLRDLRPPISIFQMKV